MFNAILKTGIYLEGWRLAEIYSNAKTQRPFILAEYCAVPPTDKAARLSERFICTPNVQSHNETRLSPLHFCYRWVNLFNWIPLDQDPQQNLHISRGFWLCFNQSSWYVKSFRYVIANRNLEWVSIVAAETVLSKCLSRFRTAEASLYWFERQGFRIMNPSRGLAQRTVRGPYCYNVSTSDWTTRNIDTKLSKFADDNTIVVQGDSKSSSASSVINNLRRQFAVKNIHFNDAKTKQILVRTGTI